MTKLNRPFLLVVDDDFDSRDLYTWALQDAGADVVAASSASEAFQVLAELKPDALLCDIVMPEMDGFMLMGKLRESNVKAWQQLPAIAVSSLSGHAYHQQAIAAGFQKFLVKPIDLDELIATINEVTKPKAYA